MKTPTLSGLSRQLALPMLRGPIPLNYTEIPHPVRTATASETPLDGASCRAFRITILDNEQSTNLANTTAGTSHQTLYIVAIVWEDGATTPKQWSAHHRCELDVRVRSIDPRNRACSTPRGSST